MGAVSGVRLPAGEYPTGGFAVATSKPLPAMFLPAGVPGLLEIPREGNVSAVEILGSVVLRLADRNRGDASPIRGREALLRRGSIRACQKTESASCWSWGWTAGR